MKAALICIGAILAFVCAPALAAKTEPDPAAAEKEIKQQVKDYEAAWSKHDASAVAAFYTKEGNVVTGSGQKLDGRDGIEKTLKDAFEGDLKDSTIAESVETIRLIKAKVAIVDSDAEIKSDNGDPHRFHLVSVLVKHGDKWLIETARAIVYKE